MVVVMVVVVVVVVVLPVVVDSLVGVVLWAMLQVLLLMNSSPKSARTPDKPFGLSTTLVVAPFQELVTPFQELESSMIGT